MKAIKLLAATLIAVLPAVAQAQGWYAGLDVGSARSDSEIDEYVLFGDTTARASGTTTAFRLRGGYQFGRFFALELAYVNFGDFDNHFDPDDCPNGAPGPCQFDVNTSIDGIVGSVVGVIPIGPHWYLDARVGYGKFNVDTQTRGAVQIDNSGSNDAFHYGIGGGYRFNEYWEVLLDFSEYNQEDFGLTLSGAFGAYNLGETSVTSVGFNYRW